MPRGTEIVLPGNPYGLGGTGLNPGLPNLPITGTGLNDAINNLLNERNLNQYLLKMAQNYTLDPAIMESYRNLISQGLYQQQQAALQQLANQFATKGGRFGNVQAATSGLYGQFATAKAQSLAKLAADLKQKELDTRMRYLNAYIQKYGIDKEAMLALKKIQAEKDAAMWGGIGNLLGNIATLGFGKLFGVFK